KQRDTVGGYDLRDVVDHGLGHRQGALTDIERQQQLALRVHRHPDPLGRPLQAFHGLGRADLAVLHRAEQGIEFIELHLGDAHVTQEILREGLEMVGHLQQPGQHGVGIDRKHPSHGADAQAFRQGPHGPHQQVGRDALAMARRAVRLQKIPLTGTAVQLAPGSPAGMPVGTDIAPVHPAPIVTGGMGAEMLRGVHLARASPARGDPWRGGWWWGLWGLGHLLTGRTVRLVDEARKGLGVGGARAARRDGLGWLGLGRHAAAGPGEVQHDTQPQESQDHELIVKLMWNHGKKPPHHGMIGGHCTRFSGRDNYPQRRGTRPDIVPTLLDVTGIPAPVMVNGAAQKPIEAGSMAYTFGKSQANAPSTRTTQYFEMFANRGIYHDGWYACTTPPAPPWLLGTAKLPDDVVNGYQWELYNLTEDYSQFNDLAAKQSDKLHELQEL